ncbi:MAG: hypothetical protein CMM87_00480 [Rickettsiales bacterium]|nr:hypothetical protein [Rickettsiales bacterium]|tara:strand:+ start:89739 stop:90485 length:747 start_codon:yes stop_codon:yes gene_type:complete
MLISADLLRQMRAQSKKKKVEKNSPKPKVAEKKSEPVEGTHTLIIKDMKGRKTQTIAMVGDVKEGLYTIYDPETGQIKQKMTYIKGVLEGPTEAYDHKGNLMFVGAFAKGKMQGEAKQFENGQLVGIYNFDQGKQHGQSQIFKNDQKVAVIAYDKGDMSGPFEAYQNGKLVKKCTYKDGVMDGVSETYYPSGDLLQQERYENGKIVGQAKKFYQNGTVMEIATYRDGKVVLLQQYNQKSELVKEKKFE